MMNSRSSVVLWAALAFLAVGTCRSAELDTSAVVREAAPSEVVEEATLIETADSPTGKSSLTGPGKDKSASEELNPSGSDDAKTIGEMNPFEIKAAHWKKVDEELEKSVDDLNSMPAGPSKDAFDAEIKAAKKDCTKYKLNNYYVCKQLYCTYQSYCAAHGIPVAIGAAVSTGSDDETCKQILKTDTQKIPADVDTKCTDKDKEFKNALTGTTAYTRCQCHGAKYYAYDKCEYNVKHVDRACLSRYRQLEVFVAKEHAHKKAVIDKEVRDKAKAQLDREKARKERKDKRDEAAESDAKKKKKKEKDENASKKTSAEEGKLKMYRKEAASKKKEKEDNAIKEKKEKNEEKKKEQKEKKEEAIKEILEKKKKEKKEKKVAKEKDRKEEKKKRVEKKKEKKEKKVAKEKDRKEEKKKRVEKKNEKEEKAADKKQREELETQKALEALKGAQDEASNAADEVNKIVASTEKKTQLEKDAQRRREAKAQAAKDQKEAKEDKKDHELAEKKSEEAEKKVSDAIAQQATIDGAEGGVTDAQECDTLAADSEIAAADCAGRR